MSSLTQTQSVPRLSHVRAYLAGTGATGALIAGAAVVLLSLAAFLAVKGMPFAGSQGNSGNAYLQSKSTGPSPAAAGAAAALGAAPGAVAAAPIGGGPAGVALGGRGPSGGTQPGPNGGTNGTNGPTPPGTSPTVSVTPTSQASSGATTNAAHQLDQTLCGQGACTGLSGQTDSATKPLDSATRNTLNQVHPGLGDQVNNTVNGAVDGLLGGGK